MMGLYSSCLFGHKWGPLPSQVSNLYHVVAESAICDDRVFLILSPIVHNVLHVADIKEVRDLLQ